MVRTEIIIPGKPYRRKYFYKKQATEKELVEEIKLIYKHKLGRMSKDTSHISKDEFNYFITNNILKVGIKVTTKKDTEWNKISGKSLDMLKKRRKLLSVNKRQAMEYTEINNSIGKQI